MEIIPGINCSDFKCVSGCWDKAVAFGARAIQIDVTDGKFAPVKTWNNPSELAELTGKNPEITPEIHLMVEKPEEVFGEWLAAGAKRLVVHIESAGDLFSVRQKAEALGAEIIWGIKTETPVEELDKYLKDAQKLTVQILAVSPGFSEQAFNPVNLKKIISLKDKWPGIEVRVDGGINLETARLVKQSGADTIISVSYIFESKNPAAAYQSLLEI